MTSLRSFALVAFAGIAITAVAHRTTAQSADNEVVRLIEHIRRAGKLTWETTLGDVFTELAAGFPSDFRAITVTQLLSHYAGLPPNLAWRQLAQSASTLSEQRLKALKSAATTTLTSRPGTKFEDSNLGYVLAGAVAERVGGKPWEELMREIVFTPLGMTSCGFGGLGTPGTIDQPWPHTANGQPTPLRDMAGTGGDEPGRRCGGAGRR